MRTTINFLYLNEDCNVNFVSYYINFQPIYASFFQYQALATRTGFRDNVFSSYTHMIGRLAPMFFVVIIFTLDLTLFGTHHAAPCPSLLLQPLLHLLPAWFAWPTSKPLSHRLRSSHQRRHDQLVRQFRP